jgi:hypothetical protein
MKDVIAGYLYDTHKARLIGKSKEFKKASNYGFDRTYHLAVYLTTKGRWFMHEQVIAHGAGERIGIWLGAGYADRVYDALIPLDRDSVLSWAIKHDKPEAMRLLAEQGKLDVDEVDEIRRWAIRRNHSLAALGVTEAEEA